jgi:signal peptidase II
MFYLDLWEGFVPEWIPFIGGEFYSLWPIFNVADASIFVGVFLILLLQRKFFEEHSQTEAPASEGTPTPGTYNPNTLTQSS